MLVFRIHGQLLLYREVFYVQLSLFAVEQQPLAERQFLLGVELYGSQPLVEQRRLQV